MKKFITVLLVTTGLSNFAFGFIDELGGAVKTGFADAINNVENFAKGGIDIAANAAKDFTGKVGDVVQYVGNVMIDTGHQGVTFVAEATTTAIDTTEVVVSSGLYAFNTAANTAAALTGGCTCNK